MICGWLYKMGIEVDFYRQGQLVSGGAVFGIAALVLYLGRQHYWALAKDSIGHHPARAASG